MSKNTFIPTTKGLVSAHKSQDFTSDQKAQARTNIAAAASTHTHSADDIVSGALAKARQHAQTAYYDQAGTWAQTQTFNGSATPAMLDAGNASWFSDGATAKSVNNGREFLRLAFDSGIRGIGRDGANHHLLRVANVPGIDGDGTYDFAILGGSTLDFVSVPTDLDLVGNDIVDMVNIGNTLGSYSPRLIQGSTDPALTVGIATTLPGGALADRLVFSNNATIATATWSNTNVVMGNTLTVSNTLTVNESISCRYGISIKELATGNASWLLYRIDGGPTQPLYLRDMANSRTHASFTPAATSGNAITELFSTLFVNSNITCGLASEGRVVLVPGGGSAIGYVAFVKPNGTRQGYIGSDSGNNISFTNEVGGKFVFGSEVNAESCVASNGYFKSQESGVDKWIYYPVSGTYYLRDAVNSRSHAIYFPGANSNAALTQFSSRLLVESNAEFSSVAKLGDFAVGTLPSASAFAGYEANVTDSSVTTFGSIVAGGGSSRVKVYSNGTNWTVQAA